MYLESVLGDVRITYPNVFVIGEDAAGQMDLIVTHEGVTTDVWVS